MKRLLPLLPIALLQALCTAQDTTMVRPPDGILGTIDTVIVAGNEKTQSYVILNEMALKSGGQATSEALEFDRNRIYSLGLFTRVDIFYDSLGTTRFLYVDVRERWYLIPVPIFGFRDGDPKKPYFGAGFLHNNVRGRNQKLFASVTLGYDPAASLSFLDPLLDREARLYVASRIAYSRVRNKSERQAEFTGDFDEHHFDVNGTIGKRFSLYETAGLNLGFQLVSVSEFMAGRTVSPEGIDRCINATLNYSYDSRDLAEYASRGTALSLYATKYGFGESVVNFARVGTDIRTYLPLFFDLTAAARVHGSFAWGGEVPSYNHVYFGYGDKIRGYFRTIFEGENIVGTSVELRWPLLRPRTIQFGGLPLPQEFTIWRFGVMLALFADAGTVWNRGDHVGLSSFASGFGGGVHFLLPYGVIVRAEYGFNDQLKGQAMIDFRTSI